VSKVGKSKRAVKVVEIDRELEKEVAALALDRLKTSIIIPDKMERQKTLDVLLDEIKQKLRKEDDRHGAGRSPRSFSISKRTRSAGSSWRRTYAPTAGNRNRYGRISSLVGLLPRTHDLRSSPAVRRRHWS